MKILLVFAQSQGSSSLGGAQTFTVNLFQALRRQGFDCELFWIGTAPSGYCSANMSSGTLADLVDFVVGRGFDVIHTSVADWDAGVALVRQASPHSALVVTNHGELYRTWNSSNCDAIVGRSEWTTAAQQAETDLPVQVVLNGIDMKRFVPATGVRGGSPIVAWVGRGAASEKRIEGFAAIAQAVKGSGARIWVADPDGPAKVPPTVANMLGAATERWAGVPYDLMPAFYQEIAASGGCVISTSPSEGLPLALIEAQASGCPVIAPNVRGVNECVDPQRGGVLYHPDLDPASLSRLVLETLENVEAMQARQQACSKYTRDRFSLDRMAAEYVKVYGAARARRQSVNGHTGQPQARVPFREWKTLYWNAAHAQYQAMVDLHRSGRRRLARLAAWRSLMTLPTIYLRPSRLARLLWAAMPALR